MRLRSPDRILIIKLSAMGDVVHTLPALGALRRAFPNARISWVVSRGFEDMLAGHPWLQETFFFERSRWGRWDRLGKTPWEAWFFLRALRARRFDWVVDFQGLLRSGLLSYATGAPTRVGFAKGREGSPWFYTHRVPVPQGPMHAVDRYLLMATALGATPEPVAFHIPITDAHRMEAEEILARNGLGGKSYVAVAPLARWESKRWPWVRFAELLDRLWSSHGVSPLLLGGAEDARALHVVAGGMRRRPVVLAGEVRGLTLAALLEGAEAMIANDTGPMHLAAAVDTPVVAFFGPTDPRRTGPYPPTGATGPPTGAAGPPTGAAGPPTGAAGPPTGAAGPPMGDAGPPTGEGGGAGHRVVRNPVSCSPCFRRVCPTDHACMAGVTVEAAAAEVASVLAGSPRVAAGQDQGLQAMRAWTG